MPIVYGGQLGIQEKEKKNVWFGFRVRWARTLIRGLGVVRGFLCRFLKVLKVSVSFCIFVRNASRVLSFLFHVCLCFFFFLPVLGIAAPGAAGRSACDR